jgi:hypothetical protein
MTGEDTAHWEDSVHAVVNYKEYDLRIALELLIVTIFKNSMNPITDPTPVYSQSYTWQYEQLTSP